MPIDPQGEPIKALQALISQVTDNSVPALSRIHATVSVNPYVEAITRQLVDDAIKEGASWEDIGQVYGTSAMNVKARFGAYRDYGDVEDAD